VCKRRRRKRARQIGAIAQDTERVACQVRGDAEARFNLLPCMHAYERVGARCEDRLEAGGAVHDEICLCEKKGSQGVCVCTGVLGWIKL
jgi:hypothetical protein